MIRALACAASAALLVCPVAVPHGDGAAQGFRSTVTGVSPPLPGVTVRVLDGDDQLYLANESGTTLVVLGYEGEPYLLITPEAVFENRRSPAAYLNAERSGDAPVPATADPKAPPRWVETVPFAVAQWHDHRIHWMGASLPSRIAADAGSPRHVFDWKVPVLAGEERHVISGSLDYEPPPAGRSAGPFVAGGAVALVVLAGGALVLLRRRRAGGVVS